ncbi:hypothetical protein [Paraburkholderia sp. CI3]|uniref:hypothetical protein n=1 Tax=Paraburkholderia sp. CI3 TaxID=2991060 RepID=UPI003D1ED469
MKQRIMMAVALALCSVSAFAAHERDHTSGLALQGGRAMSVREAVTAAHNFATEGHAGVRAAPGDGAARDGLSLGTPARQSVSIGGLVRLFN